MRHRQVTPAQWAQLTRHDPYLRWGVEPGDPPQAWSGDGVVAVSRLRRAGGPRSVVIIEQAAARDQPVTARAGDVARLAAQVLAPMAAGGLTIPRQLATEVHRRLSQGAGLELGGPPAGVGWDWMWTTSRLTAQVRQQAADSVAAARLRPCGLDVTVPAVAGEISDLLTATSPRHSARPGDPRVKRWFGLRASDDALVGCAAWYESVPGVPLLASVAVRADHRRSGLGAALMVAVSETAFGAGCPAVTVDLYADNEAARKLYQGLGFAMAQEFASWTLSGHRLDDA